MNLQEQIDVIQAVKDGRRVTYISTSDSVVIRADTDHSFNFVRNTYTIEPLYQEREVIMVESREALDGWMPAFFHEMSGDSVMVSFIDIEPSAVPRSYPYHRKLNAKDKGEA